MLTVLVHPLRETFSQATRLTLIAVCLVHGARPRSCLATVDQSATNAALEETGATIAGQNSFKIICHSRTKVPSGSLVLSY